MEILLGFTILLSSKEKSISSWNYARITVLKVIVIIYAEFVKSRVRLTEFEAKCYIHQIIDGL